jgi:hypothetical protein
MKRLAAAATASALAITTAQAAIVTVDGTRYDVSTITGTAEDLQGELESQVFFGSVGAASDFAGAVGTSLGTPNGDNGPLFVFNLRTGDNPVIGARTFSTGLFGGVVGFQSEATDGTFTFAVAEQVVVPLPAGLPLFAGALAIAGFLRRGALAARCASR